MTPKIPRTLAALALLAFIPGAALAQSAPAADAPLAALAAPTTPLSKTAAAAFAKKIVETDRKESAARGEAELLKTNSVTVGDLTMPFTLKTVGKKPAAGWPLILSFHGGGTAPKHINDGQWRNQQTRYDAVLKDCMYVAPRGPRDREPWHPYMFPCIEKLVADLIRHGEVDPDRVYMMGFSEGGYAVFRALPRLSDRFAGMAAGGAADRLDLAPAENLANVAFDLQLGTGDTGFDRIGMARKYSAALDELEKKNKGLFNHRVKLHEGAGHDCPDYRPEFAAIPWMLKHRRAPQPKQILLRQGSWSPTKLHYWLCLEDAEKDLILDAKISGNRIDINTPHEPIGALRVRLNDQMVNLDAPVEVRVNGKSVHKAKLNRSAALQKATWLERLDPARIYSAEVLVPMEAFKKEEAE